MTRPEHCRYVSVLWSLRSTDSQFICGRVWCSGTARSPQIHRFFLLVNSGLLHSPTPSSHKGKACHTLDLQHLDWWSTQSTVLFMYLLSWVRVFACPLSPELTTEHELELFWLQGPVSRVLIMQTKLVAPSRRACPNSPPWVNDANS